MRRFISLTILSLSLAVMPAAAQYGAALYPGYSNETPGMALVDGWVRRYIGRAPSAQDLANGQAIDAGTINPETLLAQILSCDEYYQKRAGSNDRRYIQVLFHDLTGRARRRGRPTTGSGDSNSAHPVWKDAPTSPMPCCSATLPLSGLPAAGTRLSTNLLPLSPLWSNLRARP